MASALYTPMAALIDKIRASGRQGQLTGNLQAGNDIASSALTSFYDAAISRQQANRQLNLAEKSQAATEEYQKASLANQATSIENTKNYNVASLNAAENAQSQSNKYQMLGLGASALGTAAQFYANKKSQENTTKMLDLVASRNGLSPSSGLMPVSESWGGAGREPLTFGSAEYNAIDQDMGTIYGSEPIDTSTWYGSIWNAISSLW